MYITIYIRINCSADKGDMRQKNELLICVRVINCPLPSVSLFWRRQNYKNISNFLELRPKSEGIVAKIKLLLSLYYVEKTPYAHLCGAIFCDKCILNISAMNAFRIK